jgi:ribosomal protein S18 acetylase RimI-like enzyme
MEVDDKIIIEQRNLSAIQILQYFNENKELFTYTFSRIRPEDFADKISRHALHFCAFHGEELSGFAACYFNHPLKEFGYITNISVIRKFQGKGIAHLLMNEIIDYGKSNGFKKLRLEIRRKNLPGLRLYSDLGFEIVEKNDESCFMELSMGV